MGVACEKVKYPTVARFSARNRTSSDLYSVPFTASGRTYAGAGYRNGCSHYIGLYVADDTDSCPKNEGFAEA